LYRNYSTCEGEEFGEAHVIKVKRIILFMGRVGGGLTILLAFKK
jgi:hypothetical protein